jgi:hypothetical protein
MKSRTSIALACIAGLWIAGAACSSANEGPRGATETNVAPAPCNWDSECPSMHCARIEGEGGGGAGPGFCEQIGGSEATVGGAPSSD